MALIALLISACGGAAKPTATAVPPTTAPTTAPAAVASEAATAAATAAATTAATAAPTSAATQAALPPGTIRLQSKWVVQAQFAGYYEALAKGYYKDMGLDVTILPGGPDITPEQVVASGGAEFGIDWLPSLLSSREHGAKLVNVSQVFARSGMREVSFTDKNIKTVTDLKGKKVGVWTGGNEFELYAALVKNNLDPKNSSDVDIQAQPFDMSDLLSGSFDAAAAMTYNEYAQILEANNPKTSKPYTPEELNVIDFNTVGTAMLEDGIFANAEWLAKPGNEDVAVKFIAASLKGWIYCRDNMADCVKTVLDQGPTLGQGHQTWQMNEINKLIWPNTLGIGLMDPAAYQQTADIALKYAVITKAPDKDAYRTDLAEKAVKLLTDAGIDVKGANFAASVVTLQDGGKSATVADASATMEATTAATMAATP